MNHRTTTSLVVIAAIAATLLAAGLVAALGRNQFAFAHRDYMNSYDKYDKYGKDQQQRDGDQYLNCIVIGGGSDGFKRSDGERQGDDLVTTPGLISEDGGRGITDNSCNNYDSGSINPPTPIPVACGTGTVFGASLRADLSERLPEGTILCLQSVGNNKGITALLPPLGRGGTTTADIVVAQVGQGNQCQSPFVLAKVVFGTPPNPLSADFVCVKTV
jgi:hypothetical protein